MSLALGYISGDKKHELEGAEEVEGSWPVHEILLESVQIALRNFDSMGIILKRPALNSIIWNLRRSTQKPAGNL